MKRLIPVICILVLLLAGCGTTASIDMDKYLDPVKTGDKVPPLGKPAEIIIPYIVNAQWASELAKFVPLYDSPQFLTEKELGKPEISENTLTKKATDINAQSFHKADPRDVFQWISSNYKKYSYQLDSTTGRDSLVWIAGDEHGYFLLKDQDKTMEIQVWKLDAYPGWTKVVYQGTTYKACGCGKK